MLRRMTIAELETNLLDVIDDLAGSEGIEITRDGVTIARLVPWKRHWDLKGLYAGVAKTTASDEELFSTGEVWEAQ